MPYTGSLLFSAYSGNGPAPVEGTQSGSTSALRTDAVWNIAGVNGNCGVATLL